MHNKWSFGWVVCTGALWRPCALIFCRLQYMYKHILTDKNTHISIGFQYAQAYPWIHAFTHISRTGAEKCLFTIHNKWSFWWVICIGALWRLCALMLCRLQCIYVQTLYAYQDWFPICTAIFMSTCIDVHLYNWCWEAPIYDPQKLEPLIHYLCRCPVALLCRGTLHCSDDLKRKTKNILHLLHKNLPSHRGVAGEVLRAGYTM